MEEFPPKRGIEPLQLVPCSAFGLEVEESENSLDETNSGHMEIKGLIREFEKRDGENKGRNVVRGSRCQPSSTTWFMFMCEGSKLPVYVCSRPGSMLKHI